MVSTERLRPLFYVIENYAKIRAASTGVLDIVKCFGSGNGHGLLFYVLNLRRLPQKKLYLDCSRNAKSVTVSE